MEAHFAFAGILAAVAISSVSGSFKKSFLIAAVVFVVVVAEKIVFRMCVLLLQHFRHPCRLYLHAEAGSFSNTYFCSIAASNSARQSTICWRRRSTPSTMRQPFENRATATVSFTKNHHLSWCGWMSNVLMNATVKRESESVSGACMFGDYLECVDPPSLAWRHVGRFCVCVCNDVAMFVSSSKTAWLVSSSAVFTVWWYTMYIFNMMVVVFSCAKTHACQNAYTDEHTCTYIFRNGLFGLWQARKMCIHRANKATTCHIKRQPTHNRRTICAHLWVKKLCACVYLYIYTYIYTPICIFCIWIIR